MGSVAIPGFGGLGWVWEAVCSDSWVWRRSEGGPVRRGEGEAKTKQGARSSPSSCIEGRRHVRRMVWRWLEINFATRIWCFGGRLEVVCRQLCE